MVADLNEELAAKTAEDIRIAGGTAEFIACNATIEDDVQRMISETVTRFGDLNCAANVIGINHPEATGPDLHDQTIHGWDVTVQGSLTTTFLCCKYEIAHMIKNGGGSIVNTASAAAFRYIPISGAAYSAAKAGVVQFTKFAAVAYAANGIRINCIAPGSTYTPAFPPAAVANFPDLPPEKALKAFVDAAVEHHPIKRLIECDEIAAAFLWLCSDEALMLTGQTMSIDGGWTAT
jgi:NAD(P)-dependent dehydrogenase (short-subunit alcohol dehydrogenase family)